MIQNWRRNKMSDTGNLPSWKNADRVYSNAYKMLESMAKNGHVQIEKNLNRQVNTYPKTHCVVSDDMNNLIEALDNGNEEEIKGLMLLYRAYNFDIKGD
jgi:hypothetical protein